MEEILINQDNNIEKCYYLFLEKQLVELKADKLKIYDIKQQDYKN